jgi:hypothetical protein
MKKSKLYKGIIILSILTALTTLALYLFGFSLIGALVIHSEKIGLSELKIMMECKNETEKYLRMSSDIPLPKNSAQFSNSVYPEQEGHHQFLTSTRDLEDYFAELNNEGWQKVEQMTGLYIFKKTDSDAKFNMILNNYTRFYFRLDYYE